MQLEYCAERITFGLLCVSLCNHTVYVKVDCVLYSVLLSGNLKILSNKAGFEHIALKAKSLVVI